MGLGFVQNVYAADEGLAVTESRIRYETLLSSVGAHAPAITGCRCGQPSASGLVPENVAVLAVETASVAVVALPDELPFGSATG